MPLSVSKNADEKDLKIYELELYVKDLQADLRELSDAKEKLLIANRNARVLEEENSNLQRVVKACENDGQATALVPQREEARKLIQENSTLSDALAKSRAETQKAAAAASQLEKSVRSQVEERERLTKESARKQKELENARRLCMELQQQLDAERETANAERDLWEQERDQLLKKTDEALAAKRHDAGSLSSDAPARSRVGGSTLQEKLLKEEVQELESKLRDTQQALWKKEKEWVLKERDLCGQIKHLEESATENAGGDKEIFSSLQLQIAALKEEVSVLRKERRSSRLLDASSMLKDLPTDSATTTLDFQRGVTATQPPTDVTTITAQLDRLAKELNRVQQENSLLVDERDELKSSIISLKAKADAEVLKCRELEALLNASRAKNSSANPATFFPAAGTAAEQSISPVLTRRVNELESEIERLRLGADQSKALASAQVRDYQDEIEALRRENDELRNHTSFPATSGAQSVTLASAERLSKDKRDSVEDVMRQLEAAWDVEEDAKRQLRKANWSGAALASHDAAKDDEIMRLQRLVNDIEEQLRDLQRERDASRQSVSDSSDALQKLAKDLRAAQDECSSLRDALNRRNLETKKLESDNADLSRKAAEMQRGLKEKQRDLEDENDRLRRLSARRDTPRQATTPRHATHSPRAVARAPATPEQSLTPRSFEERRRSAVPEGAHLVVSVVELSDLRRGGQPITEPGFVIIKLKSIKEKYKTSVKELTSVIRFDESFVFYLAQPDQDVITLHVYYKPKSGSKEHHIGDACFSMATLHRGVTRQRIAPVVQKPGTKEASRAALIEVNLQTDDFGKMTVPSAAEVEQETQRFNDLVDKFENSVPEKLHAADVYMASIGLQ